MHDEQSFEEQSGDSEGQASAQEPVETPRLPQEQMLDSTTNTPEQAERDPQPRSAEPQSVPDADAAPSMPVSDTPSASATEPVQEMAEPPREDSPSVVLDVTPAAPSPEEPSHGDAPTEPAPAAAQPHEQKQQQHPSKRAGLSAEYLAHWRELQDAQRERKQLEMRVVRKIKGGTILDFKGLDVFMPFSHWHVGPEFSDAEIDSLLGHTIPVRVIEVSAPEKGRAVASRRKMLMEEKTSSLAEGQVIKGTVSGVTSFGIFVDLGGVEGLVHMSQMGPRRVQSPAEKLKVGEEVTVTIFKIDQKRGRIWLNMQDSPSGNWADVETKYAAGSVHPSKVVLVKKYGVFVELEPTIEAFIHGQELSWTHRVKDPSVGFKIGDAVDVKILKIKSSARKIEASVKQAKENPWAHLATIYRKGALCEGRVREIVEKGAVVELPDDVDGFLPRSKMAGRGGEPPPELHLGDILHLRVVDFSEEQQFIIVGIRFEAPREGARPGRERREPREPRREERREEPSGRGERPTLGELISDKIRRKLQGSK